MGSHTVGDVLAVPPPWLPGDRFFENAATAWQKGNLGRLLFNSLVVAVGITVGKIAVSLLSAFAISYFRFRYRMTAFWLIFASLMLPVEVRILPTYEAVTNVALPLQWLFDGLGIEITLEWNMMNSYGGLILPLIASATATFLFRQFFLTVPEELCEAARIDGASPLHFFRHVLLPLSMSNMVALSIILFLYGWNQYLWPLLFTTEKDMATAVIGLKHLIPQSDAEPAWNVADERGAAGDAAARPGRGGAAALAGEGPGRQRQVAESRVHGPDHRPSRRAQSVAGEQPRRASGARATSASMPSSSTSIWRGTARWW